MTGNSRLGEALRAEAGSRARGAGAGLSLAGGAGRRSLHIVVDPGDNSSVDAPSRAASVLLTAICAHPRVVSACEGTSDELRFRIERNDADQIIAWLALIAARSPLLVGARLAYHTGLAQGREPVSEISSPDLAAAIKDAILQYILRSSGEGAL